MRRLWLSLALVASTGALATSVVLAVSQTRVAANLSGRLAQPPDAYPGHYTSETTGDTGTVNGMLSVNAGTGQVWYHSWHGRYLAKEDS